MKRVYRVSCMWDVELEVGSQYILVYRSNVLTGKNWYVLMPDNGKGVPGNLDSSICCYHGWCGTTRNIATYAEGLYRLEEIIRRKDTDTCEIVTVRLSADLKPFDS